VSYSFSYYFNNRSFSNIQPVMEMRIIELCLNNLLLFC